MKFIKLLFSGTFMGILLVILAFSMGYATFIENDYDAITAKFYVYNSRWFEILLLLMVVNFSGMIFTKKLYLKSKLNILLIHIALILIIVGAGITRYIGYEGMMHIRNGQSSNTITSNDTFFTARDINSKEGNTINKKFLISPKIENVLDHTTELSGQPINFRIERYLENAGENLVKIENGSPYISIIIGLQDGRHELLIKEGESKAIHEIGFSFGDTTKQDYVQIIRSNEELLIRIPQNAPDNSIEGITNFIPLEIMSVQQVGNNFFVVRELFESARLDFVANVARESHRRNMVKMRIDNEVFYAEWGKSTRFNRDDLALDIYIGPLEMKLPFAIKLNEFQLERYPGSKSPSSFASDITLIDEKKNLELPYRIFMNNILSYGGFRFYQSSYDQDEKGTILSVNHDYWGTIVTYAGYFLLFATLILSFFIKKNRFHRLLQHMSELHEKRKKLALTLLLLGGSILGPQASFAQEVVLDKDHASAFGKVLVQNKDGRVIPLNTVANQILVKIHKKSSYNGLTPEQVILGVLIDRTSWFSKPIIKIGHPSVKKMLNIEDDLASYNNFFDEHGQFRLGDTVNFAFSKKPALRTTVDKELIKVNERLTILHKVLQGNMFKMMPLPGAPNHSWYTPREFLTISRKIALADSFLIENYQNGLKAASQSGDYSQVDQQLAKIIEYQRITGGDYVPSVRKTNVEIFYNETNIFKSLFPVYLTLGIILVGIFFLQIIVPAWEFKKLTRIFFGLLFLAFLAQTAGLVMRWYIAGHAPWSNGYESMIYISWATMLAGFLFAKRSPITLALTSTLAGITLLTAHMSWMDPEITNLVPVLKSYWLTIHVATITASYGFLALASLMGFFNLCLMIFRTTNNLKRLNLALRELTLIIELTLMFGIVLLVIGNFLGAIWANESWGRYWGWDPKETWTLVTIIVYSFILHLSLIPGMKNLLITNFLSMIGFSTVLMTYFGVNFYLTGLHSYAEGDPIPIPTFVYYTLTIMGIITVLAAYNQYKLKHQMLEAPDAELSENTEE